jgi:hypothetical protein
MNGTTSIGRNGQHYPYYRCVARIQKGPAACKGVTCKAGELEQSIIRQIVGFDAATMKREIEEYKRRMAADMAPRAARHAELQTAFEGFREREQRLLELYETNAIDLATFKERRGQLEAQRLVIAAELTENEVNAPQGGVQDINADALTRDFKQLQATFKSLSLREKQRLLQTITQEITIRPDGTVDVHFTPLAGIQSPAIPFDQYVEIKIAKLGE